MSQNIHSPPRFSPLDMVLVLELPLPDTGDAGILGAQGLVIWRTSCFAEERRSRPHGWLYVVHFPSSGTYDRIAESRLAAAGEMVPLSACLGRDFEISYDRDGAGPAAIAGVFRLPGGFWNKFVFRNAAVDEPTYEIRIPARFYSGGIATYDFAVPETMLLDCECIERVMARIFDAREWRRVFGPESQWFC